MTSVKSTDLARGAIASADLHSAGLEARRAHDAIIRAAHGSNITEREMGFRAANGHIQRAAILLRDVRL